MTFGEQNTETKAHEMLSYAFENGINAHIRRELSDMLLTDKVLQYVVSREAALGADRYLSSLTTVSDIEVSADLQVVKVYISIFGDERGKDIALAGLKSKAKYVRSALGKRMKLRLTPEIRFIEDESLERGNKISVCNLLVVVIPLW